MKKVTILKALAFFIAWMVSIQFLPTGLELMSKPSSLYFTLGILTTIITVVGAFYFAGKFGVYASRSVKEFKNKQQKVGESK